MLKECLNAIDPDMSKATTGEATSLFEGMIDRFAKCMHVEYISGHCCG